MSDCPVTLITGARKGIGRGLAEHYVRAGHQVIGCGRQGCDWEAKEFSYFRCDVTDESSVRGLFAKIRSNHGRLDHLINNAGIASLNHALLTPMTTVEKILSTNVSGVFLMCREAARLMQQRKYGRIVNLASVATPLKVAGEAVYAASKAAVVSLTELQLPRTWFAMSRKKSSTS
jgi:3-oxoacyl-[acyl-carrier protein] reductase